MNSAPRDQQFSKQLRALLVVYQWFAVLLVFVLAGVGPLPDENETVYLAKAKHFWNPQWCAGDLFLQSADTHWLFYASLGWMTRVADLETVALVGRAITWSLQAAAWLYLVRCVSRLSWIPLISAVLLAVAAGRGRFSGEWLFGGFEAKGLAYAAAWAGWGALLDRRGSLAALAFGLSIGLHPLVGGWMALAVLVAMLVVDRRTESGNTRLSRAARPSAAALALGAALAALGIVPAIAQDFGTPAETLNQARQIYVFDRLPHHLYPPQIVAGYGWPQPALMLAALAVLAASRREPAARLLAVAVVVALLLATSGWVACSLLTTTQCAALLRFYLFRPLDGLVPLGGVLGLAIVWPRATVWLGPRRATILACVAVLLLSVQLSWQAFRRMTTFSVDQQLAPSCRVDWLRACRFIREKTPSEAVCITPVFSQSFKWHAHRAEVATWKDCPQDASHIVAWWERIASLYGRVPSGGGRYWFGSAAQLTPERLAELTSRYGASYLLIERNQSAVLPFPIAWQGECYRLHRLPERSPDPRLQEQSAAK